MFPGSEVFKRMLSRIAVMLYYDRVEVLHPERIPQSGPNLMVGLHRNGAVDGFVYKAICPRAEFMISTQLRRSLPGKLLFSGIEVMREKDAGLKVRNDAAIEACVLLLGEGGTLFILPEGTSDLGPHHSTFKRGAAVVAASALDRGFPIRVTPLGIHYERAWAFRSRVVVVVGEEVDTSLPGNIEEKNAVCLLHGRMVRALEDIGVNVDTSENQGRLELLASLATITAGKGYFAALKALEPGVPADVGEALAKVQEQERTHPILRFQGVPLVPLKRPWLPLLTLPVLAPFVSAAILLNLPPLLAALWAGWRLPDGRNVIALWRLLVGLPSLILWGAALLAASTITGRMDLFCVYLALSWFGLKSWRSSKKQAVSAWNWLIGRPRRTDFADLHRLVSEAVAGSTISSIS